ncbi:MAG TPA: GYD domain-containing protein [Deltaproteobacteria bacterium]|nr:GYD domain-containing protein [Deltaproteobacteria bacterium]
MPKYISLVKYTQKGIENIKESANRFEAFKQLCESMGAKVEGFYLTMGRYDLLVIVDAPDSETIAKIFLTTASKGAVSTETLQAFSEDEYRKIISELP